MMSSKVVIIQEYIPQYRAPFFDRLHIEALKRGIDVRVAHGSASAAQASRNDGINISWGIPIAQKEFSLADRRVVLRDVSAAVAGADLVVLEQARRNLDAYKMLSRKTLNGPIVSLWGHGKDFTHNPGFVDRTLLKWLTNRADWFFAYTQGGATAVTDNGFPSRRITVVQNSIDTASLKRSVGSVSERAKVEISKRFDLVGKTALFIGALDSTKRLDFLLTSAQKAREADPDFRLLIAGEGPLRGQIENWDRQYAWLHYVGSVSGSTKAQVMAASQVLAMPGRVGLVAVDGFAAELPIVTTNWPWHAPEFEYLSAGRNSVVTSNNESAYGAALVSILRDTALLDRLKTNAKQDASIYTVEAMVSRFLAGIVSALKVRET